MSHDELISILVPAVSASITGGFALLAIVLSGRKTRREVDQKIGSPNGHGNVVQMVESALLHLGRQDEKQDRVLTRLGRIESKQAKDHDRLVVLEERSI